MKKYTTLFFVFLGLLIQDPVFGQTRPIRFPLEGFSDNTSKLAQYQTYVLGFRSQGYYIKENALLEALAYAGFQKNGFGVAYSYGGYSLYHKQYARFLYTHTFGKRLYFGILLGYERERFSFPKIDNYLLPPIQGMVLDLSLSAEISSELIISSRFFGKSTLLNAKKKNTKYGITLDADYLIAENLSVSAGGSLESEKKADFFLSFSYLLAKHYLFYLNSSIPSFVHSLGFGYENSFLKVCIGLSYQMPLGIGVECGVLWKFRKTVQKTEKP